MQLMIPGAESVSVPSRSSRTTSYAARWDTTEISHTRFGTDPAYAGRVKSPPEIVAHRGSNDEEPEHSLAAYLRAIDEGADAIECDVRLTADGTLVCVHDRRIDLGSVWLNDLLMLGFLATAIGLAVLSYRYIETPARDAVSAWLKRRSQPS